MIIEPKVRGFICTTAHPIGCEKNVEQQITYVKRHEALKPIKNVLIIGCSTGYGLATRIVADVACNANTLGVMFERPASGKRTATAGWYNTAAFENFAQQRNHYAKTLNGDAFTDEMKQQVIDTIKADMPEGLDLIIYSLAAPRRTDPVSGETFNSCLKSVGDAYTERTVNILDGKISEVTIEPATAEEISNTEKVMGGEDWLRWIEFLLESEVLNQGVQTVAYTYIGPKITYPIYRQGTIGKAKEHLEKTTDLINGKLAPVNGEAVISVNKAVVTQASSAIPVLPLYAAILYKVMKEAQLHEDCIEQIYRLFHDYLATDDAQQRDKHGFIRVDDWELRDDIQQQVDAIWPQVSEDNINDITDITGYRKDFFRLFGFEQDGVDYTADIAAEREVASIKD